jgi:hypothetical protein
VRVRLGVGLVSQPPADPGCGVRAGVHGGVLDRRAAYGVVISGVVPLRSAGHSGPHPCNSPDSFSPRSPTPGRPARHLAVPSHDALTAPTPKPTTPRRCALCSAAYVARHGRLACCPAGIGGTRLRQAAAAFVAPILGTGEVSRCVVTSQRSGAASRGSVVMRGVSPGWAENCRMLGSTEPGRIGPGARALRAWVAQVRAASRTWSSVGRSRS